MVSTYRLMTESAWRRLRLDGTVLDLNRASVEVCGFRLEDLLGRLCWDCGWFNRSREVQDWVRGAVMQARFTSSALTPDQFLKVPAALDAPDPPPAPRGGGRGPAPAPQP